MHHRIHYFCGRPTHGFFHFGRRFMEGGGPGGRGFGMGRKLSAADLQLLILKLLEEKPSHGYEIIKALDEHSKGFYVPSPGMVYPALTYLEEIGHATVEAVGARKQYHITPAGKAQLDANRARADALLAQFARVGERMDRVRRTLDAEDSESAEHGRHGSKDLHRASRDLKVALADKWHSTREEQQRVAKILARATAEIMER
jgi:DNA-binding PadR family transcriptional regulator